MLDRLSKATVDSIFKCTSVLRSGCQWMGEKSMDQFQTEYYKLRFKDKQEEEPKIYSTCICGQEVYEGEVCLDVYGSCCCDDFFCLMRTAGARRLITTIEDE